MADPNKPGFWQGSKWYLAQVLHVIAGAYITSQCIFHGWSTFWIIGILFALACVKEFYVDMSSFENDSLWSSFQDWFFYVTGVAAGWLTVDHFWLGNTLLLLPILVVFTVDLYQNANWAVFAGWFTSPF